VVAGAVAGSAPLIEEVQRLLRSGDAIDPTPPGWWTRMRTSPSDGRHNASRLAVAR
jgi:hypothetical protein